MALEISEEFMVQLLNKGITVEFGNTDPDIVVPISDETTNKELDTIEKEWDARIIEAEDNKLASDMAQFSQGVDFDHEF